MSDPAKYRSKEEPDKAKDTRPSSFSVLILGERGWIDEASAIAWYERSRPRSTKPSRSPKSPDAWGRGPLSRDITVAPLIPQE